MAILGKLDVLVVTFALGHSAPIFPCSISEHK